MTGLADIGKKEAYHFLWSLPDADIEELFPMLDGFWSSKTHRIIQMLDPSFLRKKHMCPAWIWLTQDWACPICKRDKSQIGMLGKAGKIVFDIVEHHDHAREIFQLERFCPTLVCANCNIADANAKSALQLPDWFTYSPLEIGNFIKVTPNKPHGIDWENAKEIYEKISYSMEGYAPRASDYTNRNYKNIRNHENIFQNLQMTTNLRSYHLMWAFECRSRSHFYTRQNPPKLLQGQVSPF